MVAFKYDPGSSKANKLWNSETKQAYKGSVSKPLSPYRFNVKGKSRGK